MVGAAYGKLRIGGMADRRSTWKTGKGRVACAVPSCVWFCDRLEWSLSAVLLAREEAMGGTWETMTQAQPPRDVN